MSYTEKDLLNKIPISQRAPFEKKVKAIAKDIGVPVYHLLAIMDVESGMSPSIQNKYGYTGLIQFGSTAAKELGTTTEALKKMSAVTQLDYVEKYYKMWISRLGLKKINSFADLYLIVLYPSGVKISNGNTPVMPKSTADLQAKILKRPDGNITKNSILDGYSSKYAGLLEAAGIFASRHWLYLAIGSLLFLLAAFLMYDNFIRKKPLLHFFSSDTID